jgi:hypothetical protein
MAHTGAHCGTQAGTQAGTSWHPPAQIGHAHAHTHTQHTQTLTNAHFGGSGQEGDCCSQGNLLVTEHKRREIVGLCLFRASGNCLKHKINTNTTHERPELINHI